VQRAVPGGAIDHRRHDGRLASARVQPPRRLLAHATGNI
jgi:hypothetical protein